MRGSNKKSERTLLVALVIAGAPLLAPARASVYPETPESRRVLEAREEKEERLRQRIEAAVESVSDPQAPHRGAAAEALALLISRVRESPDDLRELAYWMRRDPEAEAARWGEVILARLEGRAPDPDLVPPPRPPAEWLRRERQQEATLARDVVAHADPLRRRGALEGLMKIAKRRQRTSDPKILQVLTLAAGDADTRVSAAARFMLKSLAGDPHAQRRVYVRGESIADW